MKARAPATSKGNPIEKMATYPIASSPIVLNARSAGRQALAEPRDARAAVMARTATKVATKATRHLMGSCPPCPATMPK